MRLRIFLVLALIVAMYIVAIYKKDHHVQKSVPSTPGIAALALPVEAEPRLHPRVASRSHAPAPKKKVRPQHHRVRLAYQRWAASTDAIKVANCESGDRHSWSRYNGNPHLRDNSHYRGKWQMGFSEWRGTGGTGDPADASESEQDARAYKLWQARGWEPWSCSRIQGVR